MLIPAIYEIKNLSLLRCGKRILFICCSTARASSTTVPVISAAGLVSTNSATMCCTAELYAPLPLTVNTFKIFTGCKHKSFILYGADLHHVTLFTLKTLFIWSISDFPGKRGFWVRSSPNMQPTDHMSTAVEYSYGEKSRHHSSPQRYKADSLSEICLVRGSGCALMGCWMSAV